MKFRKLTAMLLSAAMVASLAMASAFAAPPPDAAPGDGAGAPPDAAPGSVVGADGMPIGGGEGGPGGPGGGPGGPGGSAEFTLPEGQLSVWIKDGVVVAPGTDGAEEHKVDRIVTSNEDNISSFGQGGTTAEDDDYAFITALYVRDGEVVADKSVTEAIASGATYDGKSATGVVIKSTYEGFNPIIVVDSEYTITGANITIDSKGDGSKTCDFSGLGAAVMAAGDETVLWIKDSEISVSGVANLALFADDGADVIVENSKFHSDGGTIYADYKNSPNQATMIAPPWILGIMGSSRTTNLMGTDSSTTVIDSEMSAAQWAILSTDSGTNMKLNVVNTTMLLLGADYVMQNDDTYGDKPAKDSNPYTTRAGYGTYAIGNADELFAGVDMEVGTYATIFTGGFGTYTALKKGETIELKDANGNVVTTYTPAEDKVTTVKSDTFGFMIHQGSNEITIEEGTVIESGYTTFLLKTGCSVVADVTSGAELKPGNGIILQAMDNDDATTGMDMATFSFYTEHKENAGWPTTATGASDNTGVFNFKDVKLVGDIYNATGYDSNGDASQKSTALTINLSGSTTLEGAISSTTAIHVTYEGSQAIKAAAAGEKASDSWLQYQNTSFPIGHYYDIGQVGNKVNFNGNNTIDVTVADDAAWKVTADGIVNNLTAKSAAITADKAVTITVMGTLTLDGEKVEGEKTVGNVTYKVEAPAVDYFAQYTDLSADSWYVRSGDFEQVKVMLDKGLMKGTDSAMTAFSPNASMSIAQVAQILYNNEGNPAVEGAPAGTVPTWAANAVKWAQDNGILAADADVNKTATREEALVMLYLAAKGEAPAEDNLADFTDAASVSEGAVDAMKWAVANGLFKGTDNKELQPKGELLRLTGAVLLGRYFG